ncbi:MAG: hypothetical protein Q9209_007912, partial [Squamulea sp. 1 TL-2023]
MNVRGVGESFLVRGKVVEASTIFCFGNPPSAIFPNNGREAAAGIRFSGVSLERDTTSFPQVLDEFHATSRLVGDYLSSLAPSYKDWPFKAKGAYAGDISVKTKTPIMLVGSNLDLLTQLANAWNSSAGFEGSVVLEHGGYS